ncbi:MAG: AAA family ATPase, partial [Microscillaceae bacterium]|nr:AAA family ATPase [Microscillaceae bacterium]
LMINFATNARINALIRAFVASNSFKCLVDSKSNQDVSPTKFVREPKIFYIRKKNLKENFFMELEIKNLGPIKNAKIDLTKRFYVFVGYNNSGKTYLAQVLWMLFDKETLRKFTYKKELDSLKKTGNQVKITQECLKEIFSEYASFLKNTALPDLFGLDKGHFLIKNASLDFSVSMDKILKKRFNTKIGISVKNKNFEIIEISKTEDSLSLLINENKLDENIHIPDEIIEDYKSHNFILEFIINLALSNHSNPFYLPAPRLFYPVFYQYIYRLEKEKREEMSRKFLDILENSSGDTIKLKDLEEQIRYFKSPYTKPMSDVVNKLYKLNENAKSQSTYVELIDRLKKIMGGDIEIKKIEGIAPVDFRLKVDKNKNLEGYLSSSSVNQLTTLYLYLKYWAGKSDNFLIIDEPEENLHPKNQSNLLKILLSFASDKENRVLITTHSVLITEALNNYINLGQLLQKGFDVDSFLEENHLDISSKDLLTPDKIGVYFFEGQRVIEYAIEEYGVHFADFKEEERKIKFLSEQITDELYALSNETIVE